MSLRWAASLCAAGVLVLSTSGELIASGLVNVNIVDAPRPLAKWGFAPDARKVQPGTWVTWSNAGLDGHTVTAADGAFDSGNLDPSEGFSWFFDQPGTFVYVCAYHPWMTGQIVVGDGVAVPENPPDA